MSRLDWMMRWNVRKLKNILVGCNDSLKLLLLATHNFLFPQNNLDSSPLHVPCLRQSSSCSTMHSMSRDSVPTSPRSPRFNNRPTYRQKTIDFDIHRQKITDRSHCTARQTIDVTIRYQRPEGLTMVSPLCYQTFRIPFERIRPRWFLVDSIRRTVKLDSFGLDVGRAGARQRDHSDGIRQKII